MTPAQQARVRSDSLGAAAAPALAGAVLLLGVVNQLDLPLGPVEWVAIIVGLFVALWIPCALLGVWLRARRIRSSRERMTDPAYQERLAALGVSPSAEPAAAPASPGERTPPQEAFFPADRTTCLRLPGVLLLVAIAASLLIPRFPLGLVFGVPAGVLALAAALLNGRQSVRVSGDTLTVQGPLRRHTFRCSEISDLIYLDPDPRVPLATTVVTRDGARRGVPVRYLADPFAVLEILERYRPEGGAAVGPKVVRARTDPEYR